MDSHQLLAQALLEYETLSGDEIKAVIEGKPIRQKPKGQDHPPSVTPAASSAVPSAGVDHGEPQTQS